MIPNIQPSKVYPTSAQVAPQSIAAAGTANTGYVAVPAGAKWAHITLLCGALGGGSEQVDINQATSTGGAGAKALATAAIAGVTTNSSVTDYDLNLDTMDINNGFNCIRALVTNTGGTGALVAIAVKFGPAASEA